MTKELERIQKDRDDLRAQAALFETDNQRMDTILNADDPVDMQNRTMKEDL